MKYTHIGTDNAEQNKADILWSKPWLYIIWNKRKMSNKPRNSNLNEAQNINHVTERFHYPNHRRDHKKLLLTALHRKWVQCSTDVPNKGRRRDWLTAPQNFEKDYHHHVNFYLGFLTSEKFSIDDVWEILSTKKTETVKHDRLSFSGLFRVLSVLQK